ncbi:MAG: hypothetical protein WA991_03830 [Ornithinimicrobium sp.]
MEAWGPAVNILEILWAALLPILQLFGWAALIIFVPQMLGVLVQEWWLKRRLARHNQQDGDVAHDSLCDVTQQG